MSAVRLSLLGCFAGAASVASAQVFPRFLTPQVFAAGSNPSNTRMVMRRPGGKAADSVPPPAKNSDGTQTTKSGYAMQGDEHVAQVDTSAKKKREDLLDWLRANVVRRVQVTGNRNLGYHIFQVDGDYDAFASLNYYGMGGSHFTDTGRMSVAGKNVLGFLNFDLAFTDNNYNDPDSQHITLTYDRGPVRMSLGDIRGSLLNTNPYATFNKSLKGAMAQYGAGRFRAAAVRSQSKGTARTISIAGENSAGPYYLQSGRIIPDSVQVQVDGRTMKLTDDYLVNTDIGTITFVNRIVAPTSTIVVSYESYDYGSNAGSIDGVGVSYDLGRFGQVGLTGMRQITGLSGATGPITQRFYGYGSAAAQYWLDYEPTPGTVQIKVDGILQIEGPADAVGGDYYFDPSSPYVFYFKRAIGTSQLIDVTYRPKNTNSTDGDRQVWGFDYQYPLGKAGRNGYIQYAQATGQLRSESNPMSGTARGVDGQYRIGNLSLRGSVRNIPGGYVTVQSQGFQRNEQASSLGLDYTQGRFVYSATMNNSRVDQRSVSGSTTTDAISRLTSATAGVSYQDPGGTTWALSHTRTRNFVTDDVRLDTTSFSGTKRWGHLSSNYGVDFQNGYGPISDGTSSTPGSIALQTYHLGTRYELDSGLAVDARASLSSVRTPNQDGTGTDLSFGLAYRPRGRFATTANYTQSDGGAVAALSGFSSGSGYGGNGFSGGSLGSGAYSTAGTKLRQIALTSEYQASRRLNLSGRATTSRSEGSLSSNADSVTYGLAADVDLGNFTQLSVGIDQTHTDYLTDVAQNSDSTSLSLYLNGSPAGRWYYRFGVSKFLTGGTGAYQQDSLSLDALFGYKIAPRQRLAFGYHNGYTTGVYGQYETTFSTEYAYQIFANMSLVGSYTLRNVANTGADATTGAYRSNGLDLELRFDFR